MIVPQGLSLYFDRHESAAGIKMGWKPRYSNDEMFAESYDWFRDPPAGSHSAKGGWRFGPPQHVVKQKLLGWLLKKRFRQGRSLVGGQAIRLGSQSISLKVDFCTDLPIPAR